LFLALYSMIRAITGESRPFRLFRSFRLFRQTEALRLKVTGRTGRRMVMIPDT
jgi:hypothetical protein